MRGALSVCWGFNTLVAYETPQSQRRCWRGFRPVGLTLKRFAAVATNTSRRSSSVCGVGAIACLRTLSAN
jgi:hypothetical protein